MPHPPPFQIGRAALRSRLEAALGEAGARVTFVHGVGGIGKTHLLRTLPSERLRWFQSLDLPELDELLRLCGEGVVIVDDLHHCPGLADTLRVHLAPRLGPGDRLVLVSREGPGPRWGADLGPGGFASVAVKGLDDDESDALLSAWRVDGAVRGELIELCAGHPLMLSLVAQLSDPLQAVRSELGTAPELVVSVVEALGAAVSDPVVREALLVTTIARRTTEALLRLVMPEHDAHQSFKALEALSWISRDPEGLYPHDLVRRALRAEAKWRDRPTYDRISRAVGRVAVQRVREHGASALFDVIFLLADNVTYRSLAAHRMATAPGPLVRSTDESLLDLFIPHYGVAHTARLKRLMRAGSLTLGVLYGEDGAPRELIPVLGDQVLLDEEPDGDPVLDVAKRLARDLDLRPGSRIVFGFGACHVDHGLTDPAANARVLQAAVRLSLSTPRLGAIASLVCPAQLWLPMMRANPATTRFEVVSDGDVEMIVQFQDLRVVDLPQWLEMQLHPPPGLLPPDVEILDRDEFGRAVRQALRSLASSGDVGRFANTPLALRLSGMKGPAAVRGLLCASIEALSSLKCREVLRRTYVEGAPKQLAVAVDLGVSYATYRRTLARGVDALVDSLWQLELTGGLGPENG